MIIVYGIWPVGRNIRRLRRRKRLSVRKLANLAGMPWKTLLRIELRLLRELDFDHMQSLCRILGVTTEDLFEKK